MRWTLALIVSVLTVGCHAATFLYDLGTDKSAVMADFTRLTERTVAAPDQGAGWDQAEGLKSAVQVYHDPVDNPSRGTTQPPPIYTNPLTEDCIVGSVTRTLWLPVPAGSYKLYLLCGTSSSMRDQYFDFQVKTQQATTRVRFEGSYQFRNVRLRATTTAGRPLAITFEPRSKWVCNAVMAWDAADDARMEARIGELEAQIYGLPPEELAKWKLEPEPTSPPLPEISDRDRARGFLVYQKPYVECIYPSTNPRPHELDPVLRAFATPGEYEPLTFAVKALRALPDVRVEAGAIGELPADTIDVRHVRYMKARPNYSLQGTYRVVPDILEHFTTLAVPAGESHRFWLTLRVPEQARPGLYQGSVTLAVAGSRVEIPIRLRVLDIKLREDPDKLYGIYYSDPLDRAVSAADEVSKEYFRRRSELEHADMVAHGTRNVTMSAWLREADAEGRFTADWTALSAKLDMASRFGFRPPYVMGINTGGVYRKYMGKESFGSHLRGLKMPPQGFFDEMRRMAAFIEAERVRRGWPEFLYYPIDEPGSSEPEVQFMLRLLGAVQQAGVKTYVTADPDNDSFKPLMPVVNVWCTQPFAPDRETIVSDMARRNVRYWCYPNHVSGENDHTPVAGARMTYGFGFWRSGFTALIPWIYQSSTGDPFNYLDGHMMDFMNRTDEDGAPIPVAIWEAYREGYDDYRYLYTLATLVKQAREGGKAAAAQEAEKELRSVWNAITVQTKYKYDGLWHPAEFDVYRWIIAQAILRLHAAGVRE